jgi:hypothetical protein
VSDFIQNISAGIIVLDMSERVVELNPYANGNSAQPISLRASAGRNLSAYSMKRIRKMPARQPSVFGAPLQHPDSKPLSKRLR